MGARSAGLEEAEQEVRELLAQSAQGEAGYPHHVLEGKAQIVADMQAPHPFPADGHACVVPVTSDLQPGGVETGMSSIN
jgi:hypothetical protein